MTQIQISKPNQSAGPTQLTEEELSFVLGGNERSDVWGGSDAAMDRHNELIDQFNGQLNSSIEGIMNFDPGTATHYASDAYDTYQQLQESKQEVADAVQDDWNYAQQLENGHNQSPSDANMTNEDGSPGKAPEPGIPDPG